MNALGYVVMAFGALLAAIGIVMFAKRGSEGTSAIKAFHVEFQLGGSALVIFVVGIFVFLVPFIYPAPFSSRSPNNNSGQTGATAGMEETEAVPRQTTSGQSGNSSTSSQTQVPPVRSPTVRTSLNQSANQSGIRERVHKIIANQLRIPVVNDSATYVQMGADELDCIELASAFEEEFKVMIRDEDLCKTTVRESISWFKTHTR